MYLFLAGLNQDFDEVRSRILGKTPLASLREAFSKIRREETRKKIMLKTDLKPALTILHLFQLEMNLIVTGRKNHGVTTAHCKKHWHT